LKKKKRSPCPSYEKNIGVYISKGSTLGERGEVPPVSGKIVLSLPARRKGRDPGCRVVKGRGIITKKEGGRGKVDGLIQGGGGVILHILAGWK